MFLLPHRAASPQRPHWRPHCYRDSGCFDPHNSALLRHELTWGFSDEAFFPVEPHGEGWTDHGQLSLFGISILEASGKANCPTDQPHWLRTVRAKFSMQTQQQQHQSFWKGGRVKITFGGKLHPGAEIGRLFGATQYGERGECLFSQWSGVTHLA